MTATKTITAADLIARYADDVAFVADAVAATTVSDFTYQVTAATENFVTAGINGTEELEAGAQYLADAETSTDETERAVLLKRAAKNLDYAFDMADEYRDMV